MQDPKPDFSSSLEPLLPASQRIAEVPQQGNAPAAMVVEEYAPKGGGINFRPVLRAIRRHPIVIVGTAALVSAIAVFTSGLSNPSYQGKFQILVEPVTPDPSNAQVLAPGPGGPPAEVSMDYATQIQILRGQDLLSDITKQVQTKYPGFTGFELMQNLTVERIGAGDYNTQSKVLEIGFQGNDANLVRYVLEQTKNRYLRWSLDERSGKVDNAVKFIDGQLPGLRRRVSELQGQLQRLQESYQVIDPQDQGAQLFKQVREMAAQTQQIQGQLREQRQLYNNLQQQLKLNPQEAVVASSVSQNPNYQTLLAKVKEVEQQIAAASADLQPDNPQMQSLLERRQNLQGILDQESRRILQETGGGGSKVLSFQSPLRVSMIEKLIETNNGLQMLQIREQELTQAQKSIEEQARRFPGVARQYTDLRQQLELANRTLTLLLTQRETLRVQAAQREFPWKVISAPAVMTDATGAPLPNYGKATRNIMVGTAGGLFLGLALALLLERKRNVFSSTEDVQEVQDLPLLGSIPFHQPLERFGRMADTVLLQPDAEASRREEQADFVASCDYLFTNLSFQHNDPPIRAVSVCGMEPGDGQSTIAIHLARTAASMGQRVLLVDANWQKPSLHEYLRVDNRVGLSDMLVNDTNKAMIQPAPGLENLYLLPFGEMPLANGRLIASPRMMRLVEKLQGSFDFVVFDTPPLVAAMETNFLAAQTDGVILVLAVGKTKRTTTQQVMQQLKTFKIPCLGVVANHIGSAVSSDERDNEPAAIQDGFAGLYQDTHESMRERVG